MNGLCVGNIPPSDSFPGLCLEDSPLGVRFADFATVFPPAINVASTSVLSRFLVLIFYSKLIGMTAGGNVRCSAHVALRWAKNMLVKGSTLLLAQ